MIPKTALAKAQKLFKQGHAPVVPSAFSTVTMNAAAIREKNKKLRSLRMELEGERAAIRLPNLVGEA